MRWDRARARRRWQFLALVVVTTTAMACQVILGIEERTEPAGGGVDGSPAINDEDGSALTEGGRTDVSTPPTDAGPCATGLDLCEDPTGSIRCADLRTDRLHCGACRHNCRLKACEARECALDKVTDAAGGQVAAVDDKEVFYRVSNDDVAVSPLIGRNKVTGAERIVTQMGRFHMTMVDGNDLIIIDAEAKPRVRRVNKVDGGTQLLYESQGAPDPLFVQPYIDGDDVYWTTRLDIRKVKKDGTGYQVVAPITENSFGADDLVVTPNEIFFGVAAAASLWSVSKAGAGAPNTLRMPSANDTNSMERILNKIYWFGGKKLYVFDLNADAGTQVLPNDVLNGVAHSMVAKDKYLYVYDTSFGKDPKASRILRVDTQTNVVLTLASALDDGRLVVDDDYVYFAFYSGGMFRIPR